MSRYMLTYGLLPREIEVKLFGGAALIGTSRYREMSNSIGQQNVKAAIDTINSCGLLLKIMDVGGAFGRKIIFNTWTGEVLLKRLNKLI
jgi:chemotaxis protein CheD